MKNNKLKDSKNAKYRIRLDTIVEIAVRNNVSNLTARNIYTRFKNRVYKEANKEREGKRASYYRPELKEKALKLTERYFDRENFKELKILANIEGKEFNSIKLEENFYDLIERY